MGHYSNRNHESNSQPEIDHLKKTAPSFPSSKLSKTDTSFVWLAFSTSEIGPYPSFYRTPAKRVVRTDSNEKLHCAVTNSTWSLFSTSFISTVLKPSLESVCRIQPSEIFITVTHLPILDLISAFGSEVVLSRSVGKWSHSQFVSCDS